MVWLVQALVHCGPVKPPVDKVDAEIREPEKEGRAAICYKGFARMKFGIAEKSEGRREVMNCRASRN